MKTVRERLKVIEEHTVKTSEQLLRETYITMQAACGIEVGDTVRITRKAADFEMGWGEDWAGDEMIALVGKTGVVSKVHDHRPNGGFKINDWYFPFFVLELVSKKPRSIKLRLSDDYDAQVFKDKIVVGCQTFPISAVEAILRASKELQ